MDLDRNTFEATFEAFYDLIYHEDHQKLDTILQQIRQTNQPMDFMFRGVNRDKEISYLKCRAQGI